MSVFWKFFLFGWINAVILHLTVSNGKSAEEWHSSHQITQMGHLQIVWLGILQKLPPFYWLFHTWL